MKFRYARHSNDLVELKSFYMKVLGFDFLGEFKDHDHYDGIFLGRKNSDWHLEFTSSNEYVVHTCNQDDILVFYPVDKVEHATIINNIKRFEIKLEKPANPYWMEHGVMIKDPDGFFIVIANLDSGK